MTPLLAASIYWNLPLLLVVFSLVYSATRHDSWPLIIREAVGWGVRVSAFLGGIGLVLFLFSAYPDYWIPTLVVAGLVVAGFTLIPTLWARRKGGAAEGAAQSSGPTSGV